MKRANAGTAEKRCPIAGVEIPITDIGPLMIGQTENKESGTGCTVLVCKDGMRAGLDLRGGGPASRDIHIYDWRNGVQIAGLLTEDKTGLRSTIDYMSASIEARDNKFTGNTTLAVVVTNAAFNKPQLCTIAGMAHNGYARSIDPSAPYTMRRARTGFRRLQILDEAGPFTDTGDGSVSCSENRERVRGCPLSLLAYITTLLCFPSIQF